MTSKRVEYDRHAIDRMRERGITRQDVRWLLAQGRPASADQRMHSEPVFGREGYLESRREAKIIYLENAERVYIVTVMWTDEGRNK